MERSTYFSYAPLTSLARLSLFFVSALVFASSVLPQRISAEETPEEKRARINQQIQTLENEANSLDRQIADVRKQSKSLAGEVESINTQIKRQELEIKRINLVLEKARRDIDDTTAEIARLSAKIDRGRKSLGAMLLFLYAHDQKDSVMLLFQNRNVSDFFHQTDSVQRIQSDLYDVLNMSKEDRELEAKEKDRLLDYRQEQQELKSLQEIERKFLADKRKEKDHLLKLTKGNEALFQKLLQLKKTDIVALKTQLFYLEKTGITAEDALKFAELAAKRAGIRPAFLLALLEVETGKQFENGVISVGTNLGTGHWKRDLYDCYIALGKKKTAETQRSAIFQITAELGFDPDQMPVSRRPNYGCGGAMGPAQFLPSTWLLFRDSVARLTGHNPPNPWNVEDAFTAAAVFLADAGADAQTENAELRAAKTYISGSPNCTSQICRSYSRRIIALAEDIDRIL